MRYFAITAALIVVLAAAFLALPFINTAFALDSSGSPVQEVAAVDTVAEAVIPVTDPTRSAPIFPAAVIRRPEESLAAAQEKDQLERQAAAESAAELAAQQALQAQLDDFIASVTNGWSSVVTGLFVPDVMALPVGQQPAGNAGFITTKESTATQFSLASDYGAIGILAHNYLSGERFFDLSEGMQVYVIYGDGSFDLYNITRIRRFQALQPNSPYSNFLDLDDSAGAVLSAAQLFDQIYNQPGRLILQTCINAYGVNTWGRLFISAELLA